MSEYAYTNGRCDTCGCAIEGQHHSADCCDAHQSATDLPDRLRATSIPECVEFAKERQYIIDVCMGSQVPIKVADACITKLLDDFEDKRMQLKADIGTLKGLLEQAEAEVQKLRTHLRRADTGGWFYSYDEERTKRIDAEARNRALVKQLAECDYQRVTQSDKDRIVELEGEVERLQRVAEDVQTDLLGQALAHDLTIPTLAARLARDEQEHGADA